MKNTAPNTNVRVIGALIVQQNAAAEPEFFILNS
jgi:hypothetical protein